MVAKTKSKTKKVSKAQPKLASKTKTKKVAKKSNSISTSDLKTLEKHTENYIKASLDLAKMDKDLLKKVQKRIEKIASLYEEIERETKRR